MIHVQKYLHREVNVFLQALGQLETLDTQKLKKKEKNIYIYIYLLFREFIQMTVTMALNSGCPFKTDCLNIMFLRHFEI